MPPPGSTPELPSLTCHLAGRGTTDVLFRLEGRLSGDDASRRFERLVAEQCLDERVRRIHVEIHGLDAIDLEGIAVLVRVFRESERHGTPLSIERSAGAVRGRLVTTGVLRILERDGPTATAS